MAFSRSPTSTARSIASLREEALSLRKIEVASALTVCREMRWRLG
jgi:hypothetical protein